MLSQYTALHVSIECYNIAMSLAPISTSQSYMYHNNGTYRDCRNEQKARWDIGMYFCALPYKYLVII